MDIGKNINQDARKLIWEKVNNVIGVKVHDLISPDITFMQSETIWKPIYDRTSRVTLGMISLRIRESALWK